VTGRVRGKVAIVTGAAQGIGEAAARLLAGESARVVLADLQDELGQSVANDIGESARFIHTDVVRLQDWEELVSTTVDAYSGVDILVNNVGGALQTGPMTDETELHHRYVLDINVTASCAGMRAVAPAMIARGSGSIVNISSMDSLVGARDMASYSAAKFAVTGLTRSFALEVGHDGIRVNSVHPGFIATPLVAKASSTSLARIENAFARQPIARLGRPDEVAEAVLFFASDASSFCTGSSVVVDGGHLAGPYRDALGGLEVVQ
jgi:3alpha(or 20beta)-hydroxysteroid dehydrogenase